MEPESEELRVRLIRRREELERQLQSLTAEARFSDYEERVEHDRDGGYERQNAAALSGRLQGLLAEVEHALEKFELGTYGCCDRCGQRIPPERLQIFPQAALCVACKSRAGRRPLAAEPASKPR
jgi:DnaK suppressor protein